MLALLLAQYLGWQVALALPLSALDQIAAGDNSGSCCSDPQYCRTTYDIVWSCLVTIFSCTWVTLHPNVPGPNDSSLTIALHRCKLVVLALIAPEFLVSWAFRQWLVAGRLSRDHKGSFFTLFKV